MYIYTVYIIGFLCKTIVQNSNYLCCYNNVNKQDINVYRDFVVVIKCITRFLYTHIAINESL